MPQFQYKALSPDGRVIRGRLQANSKDAAIAELRQRRQFPISASVTSGQSLLENLGIGTSSKRLNDRLLSNFLGALASLLNAGIPLARSLDLLAGLRDFKSARARIAEVATEVKNGATLADALMHDAQFSAFVVAMIRAGESGGTLSNTISLLAKYIERANATRQAIISALLYPAFLIVTAFLSIGVIMIFVVPAFTPLFDGAQKALPFGAAVLLGVSDFFVSYWWILALVLTGGLLGLMQLRRNAGTSARMDKQILRLPFIGPLLAQIEAEKFCRVLSALLANGVSLPVSLDLTKDVLASPIFRKIAGEAALKVREGKTLSDLLATSDHFPSGTIDFLRIGEESGDVPGALARQADLLAGITKATIDRALTLAVPLITIGLGVVVGGIIASLLTAILSVNELAL